MIHILIRIGLRLLCPLCGYRAHEAGRRIVIDERGAAVAHTIGRALPDVTLETLGAAWARAFAELDDK